MGCRVHSPECRYVKTVVAVSNDKMTDAKKRASYEHQKRLVKVQTQGVHVTCLEQVHPDLMAACVSLRPRSNRPTSCFPVITKVPEQPCNQHCLDTLTYCLQNACGV